MGFLNTAFDSSTIRTTNGLQCLANASANSAGGGGGGECALNPASTSTIYNPSHHRNNKYGSIVTGINNLSNATVNTDQSTTIPVAVSTAVTSNTLANSSASTSQQSTAITMAAAAATTVNNLNSSNSAINQVTGGSGSGAGSSPNLITAKSSICTTYLSAASSVSSKTAEGRALWLQSLSYAAAANAASKRAYCSKTQVIFTINCIYI